MGGFPDGSVGEESTCSAGDRGDAGSSQGPEGPQEGNDNYNEDKKIKHLLCVDTILNS